MADLGHQFQGQGQVGPPNFIRLSRVVCQLDQLGKGIRPVEQGVPFQGIPIGCQVAKLMADGQQHGDAAAGPVDQGTGLEPLHARRGGGAGQEPGMEVHRDGLDAGGMEGPVEYGSRVVPDLGPDHGQGMVQAGVPGVAQAELLGRIPAVQKHLHSQ